MRIIIFILIIIILLCIFKKNPNYEHFNNNRKNLVFTSAGNNTDFYKNWCGNNRHYDIWVIYYGEDNSIYNKYKQYVDFIEKRKGSKFQNFHYVYNKYKAQINNYDRFFILDDDIVFNTNDINDMFNISKKYDLWICGPTFIDDGRSKISHNITKQIKGNLLRYVNFIEVNVPLFSKFALHKFMKYYDPILIGWGIDYLYIWACGLEYTDKYALVDKIGCINPKDNKKGNRELNKIKDVHKRVQVWNSFKQKYNIKEWNHTTYKIFVVYNNS